MKKIIKLWLSGLINILKFFIILLIISIPSSIFLWVINVVGSKLIDYKKITLLLDVFPFILLLIYYPLAFGFIIKTFDSKIANIKLTNKDLGIDENKLDEAEKNLNKNDQVICSACGEILPSVNMKCPKCGHYNGFKIV